MKIDGSGPSPQFKTTPYWWEAAPPEDASDQALPEAVDVAIVGSGYTGLCCALELADAGGKPLILEAGPLGAGASTRSGAMVTGGQKFVVSGAIRHLDAGRQAGVLEDAGELLQLVGERVKRYNLDADYRRYGRVILAHVPKHMKRLARWAELLQRHAGSTVSLISAADLPTEVGGKRYHGGLLIEDYGGLHPAKYHRALADAARTRGAILASHAPVKGIEREAGGFRVRTGRGHCPRARGSRRYERIQRTRRTLSPQAGRARHGLCDRHRHSAARDGGCHHPAPTHAVGYAARSLLDATFT